MTDSQDVSRTSNSNSQTAAQTDGIMLRSLSWQAGLAIRKSFAPVPLRPPQVDPNLTSLTAIERVAEISRYSLLRLEYFVSPGGGLRSWLRVNLAVSALLLFPLATVMPLFGLVLSSIAISTGFLLTAATNLLLTTAFILATIALITASISILRAYTSGR